jgi:AcrR family transcriptional regulator
MSETRSVSRGLRARTRDAVREQIVEVALTMFDEQGFDETTVDQIAAALDISSRSFFRYFASKEDLVLGDPMAYVEPVRERLAEALQTMPVWDALRAGFEAGVVTLTSADPVGTLRATRVMIDTPALRARNTEKHLVWLSVLEPLVADALSDSGDKADFRARAITLAALTCLDASSAEWVVREATVDYGQLLDETFALLKPATLRD